jgi:hypothetical protein
MSVDVNLQEKSTVGSDQSYSYTNSYLDADLTFEPVADEEVVSLAGGDETEMVDVLDSQVRSNAVAVDLDRGFLIRATAPDSDSADADSAATDGLAQAGAVANTIPVMLDSDGNRRYFMPDELTVQFNEGVSDDDARSAIASLNSAVVEAHRTEGYFTVTVPQDMGMFEAVRAFGALDETEFAEPSEIGIDDALTVLDDPDAELLALAEADRLGVDRLEFDTDGDGYPDDRAGGRGDSGSDAASDAQSTSEPDFSKLWGLRNFGQSVDNVTGRIDADIDGSLAWLITKGAPNVVVAVLDTGADLDHPDLRSRLLPRGSADWDFADPGDSVPQDHGSHGTHCAGTAVAAANNTGMVGVAPRARLMPLRINLTAGMNANRADAINYVADRALAEAATNRRYVINCSWRASGSIAAILRAIRRATARNVVVVFAAGNSNRDMDARPQFPGAYPEVISVAATDQSDRKATFSNFGSTVDVSAPGVNIWSTVPNDSYGFKDGTSMAAPHVAGLAALIWSRNETLSATEVREIIEDTTDNIDARNPGFVGQLGTGRINAYRALRATPAPVRPARLIRSLDFPQANAGSSSALAMIPGFPLPWRPIRPTLMFLTQQAGSEDIYFMNPFTGAVIRRINPQANETIGSLAYHGGRLWAANVTTGSGSINRINPTTGAVISSFSAPSGRGEGMTHDGTNLVYSTISQVYMIDPDTGAVRRSFPSPGGPSRALAADGDRLFVGNSSDSTISVWLPRTRIFEQTITAPGSGSVEGLAYDRFRRELYVADQTDEKIHVIGV